MNAAASLPTNAEGALPPAWTRVLRLIERLAVPNTLIVCWPLVKNVTPFLDVDDRLRIKRLAGRGGRRGLGLDHEQEGRCRRIG
jgi:hypothetical protein